MIDFWASPPRKEMPKGAKFRLKNRSIWFNNKQVSSKGQNFLSKISIDRKFPRGK